MFVEAASNHMLFEFSADMVDNKLKEDSEILDGDCSMKSMEATVFFVVVLSVVY